MSTNRLEAFSDGVFAIAITLLVLNIQVPRVPSGGLAQALLDEWPSYVSYVVSFLVIGIMWVNHHGIFQHIARVDRGLLVYPLGIAAAFVSAFVSLAIFALISVYYRFDQTSDALAVPEGEAPQIYH